MTEDVVRRRIEVFTQAGSEPKLSPEALEELVRMSKREDSSKRPPTDANWEPTWNINAAVALGWEMKAAAVVTDFDIRSADQDLSRSQMHEMCLKQADRWKRRVTESPQLEGSPRRRLPGGVLNNATDELWDVCGCRQASCSICGGLLIMDGYTVIYE